jgi:ubiquinone/menaquinone biosynthesis C-methylase UbiE
VICDLLPRFLARYVMHFEESIEDAVAEFANSVKPGARVLDAGAGEGNYREQFARQRYCGVDLGIGDASWDYSRLNVIGDLEKLPFRCESFAACVNVVTLEHVREPKAVLVELARVLAPGGRLLNGLQFFPGPLIIVAAIFFVPPALVLPLFDGLDRRRNFTLGYVCTACAGNVNAVHNGRA